MSWDELRSQWQCAAVPEPPPTSNLVDDVRAAARRLRRSIVRRDWTESLVAILLLPLAGWWTWQAASAQNWPRLGFAVLLGAWLLYVPWRLWRARRHLPRSAREQPLLQYLSAQHGALLLQARMLETVWRWYLLPPVVALSGMTLSLHGPSLVALVTSAIYVALALGIHFLNVHAARTVFRKQAADIAAQLRGLDAAP